jgi:hypothetical protein
MEINVDTTKVLRISRQTIPVQIVIDQKQLENVEYFNHLDSIINYEGSTCEIISRTST